MAFYKLINTYRRRLILMYNRILSFFFLCSISFLFFSGCAFTYDSEAIHASLKGYLFINEFVTSSEDSSDWIELYNQSNGTIDLSGFYLSDDLNDPLKWDFPEGTVIPGNDYIVVKANNDNKGFQTNFRLGRDESVVLTTPGGTTEIDSIDYSGIIIPEDYSYGRLIDGADIWVPFAQPTKGSKNTL